MLIYGLLNAIVDNDEKQKTQTRFDGFNVAYKYFLYVSAVYLFYQIQSSEIAYVI